MFLSTIHCSGKTDKKEGEYFYLQATGTNQVSLSKNLTESTDWNIAQNSGYCTILNQKTGLYLGWDISSEKVITVESQFDARARWMMSPQNGITTTIMAYTSQKRLYLDGLILTGGVQLVHELRAPYSGTRWDIEMSFRSIQED